MTVFSCMPRRTQPAISFDTMKYIYPLVEIYLPNINKPNLVKLGSLLGKGDEAR